MSLHTLLIILLIIMLLGALPVFPHSVNWGYSPVGIILLVVIILLLVGCAGYTTRVGGAYEQQNGTRYEAYTEIYRADSKLIKLLK